MYNVTNLYTPSPAWDIQKYQCAHRSLAIIRYRQKYPMPFRTKTTLNRPSGKRFTHALSYAKLHICADKDTRRIWKASHVQHGLQWGLISHIPGQTHQKSYGQPGVGIMLRKYWPFDSILIHCKRNLPNDLCASLHIICHPIPTFAFLIPPHPSASGRKECTKTESLTGLH